MIAPLLKFFLGVVLFYGALCLTLYFAQRSFIYYPDHSFPDMPEREEAGFIRVGTEDGLSLIGWYASAQPGKKTILYFHGNAGHIGHRYDLMNDYMDDGYGVLFAQYRGYGGNPGRPSEQGLYKDARAYLSFLTTGRDIPLSDIVLYGESIGSGPAVQLAVENPGMAGLLLITPFARLADLARPLSFLPLDWLLRDHYDNQSKIALAGLPQYYFIAGADEIVPQASSRLLFDAARGIKSWHDFPGVKHNDIHNQKLIDAIKPVLEAL